jgi:hypothetical protein
VKQLRADILDQLDHARKMALTMRTRLRVLEIQMAQRGSSTPPEILIEIETLTEQIKRHENEITRLEMSAVEGDLPLAEVEYRVLLAECWGLPQGRPSVVGAARLELARLRLGIAIERAQQMEQDIRSALAQEVISSVHDSFYTDYLQGFQHSFSNEFWTIGLAIRLHVDAAIEQFQALLPPKPQAHIPSFEQQLLTINQFWIYQPEQQAKFDQFIAALPKPLRRLD